MAFNLKKSQTVGNSVTPQSAAVPASAKKYNLSLEGKDIKNFNTLLETDHRPLGESPQTQEGRLAEARAKHKPNEKITEGAIQDSTSDLFPHRQFKNGEDNVDVAPINALSEAHDRKWREAFSKANKGADTEFWDKYVGEQLDEEPTKVDRNITPRASQLGGNPDRFGSLNGLPHDTDHTTNANNLGKDVNIRPLNKKEKPLEITSALRNADKFLFGIYLKANSEKRELTAEENEIVAAVNKDKVSMLMALAQSLPSQPAPNFDPHNPEHAEEVAGDEALWGNLSGFDPNSSQAIEEATPLPHDTSGGTVENSEGGFPGFPVDIADQGLDQGVDPEQGISYTGGMGETDNPAEESPFPPKQPLPSPPITGVQDEQTPF